MTYPNLDFAKLNLEHKNLTAEQRLQKVVKQFDRVALATSFGIEDQIIIDMIARLKIKIDIFTLDTGRLFGETYQTWQKTQEKYQLPIKAYYPDAKEIGQFVEQKGINSFYQSVENRKECCGIRKINPLKQALADYDCWIVGLRAAQSANRAQMEVLVDDAPFNLAKLSVLLEWSDEMVYDYVKAHDVPVNPLHAKGFVSIGCEPCTRAIQKGEDFRSGRWWWEQSSKECGLHQTR